jgi:hypothetical protein
VERRKTISTQVLMGLVFGLMAALVAAVQWLWEHWRELWPWLTDLLGG